MKDRYSVAEYAKEIGKTRQAVNVWVKQGLFDGYTETIDGVLYISGEALQKFGNERPVKDEVDCKVDSQFTDDDKSGEVKREMVDSKPESVDSKIDSKDEFIAFLQAQLADRDRQIEEYKSQIADYTNRFADLAKTGHEIADKALRTTEQAHLLQLQAALPEPEQAVAAGEEPPKKRGLFGRFKK